MTEGCAHCARREAELAEAVARAVEAETKSTSAQALREIAKYLSPENENVKQGYLLPCIRDLAQAKVSAIDSYNDLKTLMRNTRAMCAFSDCADHYGDPLAWCLKCQLAAADAKLAAISRQVEDLEAEWRESKAQGSTSSTPRWARATMRAPTPSPGCGPHWRDSDTNGSVFA